MKIATRLLVASLVLGGTTLILTGCKEEGTATKAGKAVDKGVQKAGAATGDAMNTAGDAVKDATK